MYTVQARSKICPCVPPCTRSSYCSNFFHFDEIWKMKEVDPKNMHFFTLFEKLVKIKVFDRFMAITFSDFIKIKKIGTVTWTISKLFCFILFPSMDLIFLFYILIPRILYCRWLVCLQTFAILLQSSYSQPI